MQVRACITSLFILLTACGGSQAQSGSTTSGDGAGPTASGGDDRVPTTPPGGSPGSGTLSGTVSFVGTPCPQPKGPPCDGAYPNYEVVVYAADGTTEVSRTRTGADGTFSLDLPEGRYAIFTQAGPMEKDRARTDVTVSRDALAQVSLRVDTGVR
jgi:hypothetical protein